MALIKRLTKGSPLTASEMDGNLDFLQSIYNFYTPNPKTVYDIALIANSDGVEAFSLQSAINKKDRPPLSAGDRLFIFENKFYEDLLKNDLIINESKEIKAFL